jgi:hypothetical protein
MNPSLYNKYILIKTENEKTCSVYAGRLSGLGDSLQLKFGLKEQSCEW